MVTLKNKEKISFLIVTHKRLSNEPEDWNHIILYASDNNLKTCRELGYYSTLMFDDEFEEFKSRMNCKVITEEEFKKRYWKDDWNTKRMDEYKKFPMSKRAAQRAELISRSREP